MASDANTFLGRQPILDRRQRVVAYELLFRASADAQGAVFAEQRQASVRVIVNTFTIMGMNAVLGNCRGFFNVTHDVLMSEMIEALPRDRVVLEVLENVDPTPPIVERCRQLKQDGFSIALDDYVLDDPREVMLEWTDVVKVDLPPHSESELARLVEQLRRHSVQQLAEKVETRDEFELCRELGFDLYQGYFFARPVVLEGASLDSSRIALMALLQMLNRDADTSEIVGTMKHHIDIGVNLLQLVNSTAFATRNKIATFEHAVNHLGRVQLQRWLMVLLFVDEGAGGIRSPLLQAAAHRGRLMELVVEGALDGQTSSGQQEEAFLVGMLSLVDTLLSRPLEEIIADLNLDDTIRAALVGRAGMLGGLLSLVESVEQADLDRVCAQLEPFGLDLPALQELENQAYAWVHSLAGEQ